MGKEKSKKRNNSTWQNVWYDFKKNKLALFGLFMIIFLISMALLAPIIAPFNLSEMDFENMDEGPSLKHIMGTDKMGRDIFSRLLYAGRISLSVGLVAEAIALTIGTLFGTIAGFFGGKVDTFFMRLVDMFNSFPFILLSITVVAVIGPSIYNVMIVLGILSWTAPCRIIRGQFLSIKNEEFVESAQALGASNFRIIFKHMLPNALSPLLVTATLGVGGAIMTEAALSYLGLGVQPPTPSWGNMLQAANDLHVLETKPWLWIPPGLSILLSVLSINFIGDGLRDSLDPKAQRDSD
ncbi:MAG TPA: oligopeptide ABC transporter permease [Halanaerobiales bacterium]|nr:oligopeptide ABC transporter permease [Halanaerobiales bacterium]